MSSEAVTIICVGTSLIFTGGLIALGRYSQKLNKEAMEKNRVHLKPRITVKFPATNSALAASYDRDAENLESAGAHGAAQVLRDKVKELDNGVQLK
ncbi:hypothetical protein A2767_02100 [Candidatus Roizmanbacteria bacterium RIFCSPHIGHO2_01_FULL_35_10]|uniref:Uncharacterized protein n=1 Tax=Candidatus Roizmanbacteria bacterium RIFCSPLOWO2_01_FULL_35_13 TaxID=1802055 RepID=A0A1F7I7D4_9BACT|nr:MAG: hypothetical protein A2767_02100 [Candidatus Roizmanbacteria bacterium RIFCSPHIGHO2_01_FULL_35_10]OGK39253.1 MAG: hypothetical protein A3A74_07520 [Candidatus Roizmanbacteria bacterium RIFCSPLOWO2_01_FULL_35_13]